MNDAGVKRNEQGQPALTRKLPPKLDFFLQQNDRVPVLYQFVPFLTSTPYALWSTV